MNYYSLFYGLLSLVSIVVYIGLLVFLFMRYSKNPKPTTIAILAITCMLLVAIIRTVMPAVLSRVFQPDQFLAANLIFNFFTSIGHLASIGLLIWAVYTDREQEQIAVDAVHSTVSSENPYGPPANR